MKMTSDPKPLLQVINLSTQFISFGGQRIVKAVDTVSLEANQGDSLALIGESGCGKSTLARSIIQVLPPAARISGGQVLFEGEDLLKKSRHELEGIRGEKISMILQDPMVSLNPVYTIGNQLGEGLRFHHGLRGHALIERMRELLLAVKIPEPDRRLRQWPHEMSGGMRQRIVGAIAFSCEPQLLIADEPTTNLDVTIQLQYLNLLRDLQNETGVTLLFITHDLGIVAEMCQYVIVMYAGKVVERGPVTELFDEPMHPYTKALLGTALDLQDLDERRIPIQGEPPNLAYLPTGCSFHPRCPEADAVCRGKEPSEVSLSLGRTVKCWKFVNL